MENIAWKGSDKEKVELLKSAAQKLAAMFGARKVTGVTTIDELTRTACRMNNKWRPATLQEIIHKLPNSVRRDELGIADAKKRRTKKLLS